MAGKNEIKEAELRFSKEQIVGSRKYAKVSDILAALLEDNKTYTLKEADSIIEKFGKEGVK